MSDEKYVKISADNKAADFRVIGERILKGGLKHPPYYTIENEKGYFYYEILK
jgi:hypothetical protein